MDPALLDTDILSEILKGKSAVVVERARAYQAVLGPFTISVVSVMEIVKGFHKMERVAALRKFLENLESMHVLVFDRAAAETAGRIYGDLERTGQQSGE